MNQIQCPNCKTFYVDYTTKYGKFFKGGIAGIIGLVMLYESFDAKPGLIFLALPFLIYSGLQIYIGIKNKNIYCTCQNCNYQFTKRP